MQIHELTQRNKRTDEGLLDLAKKGASAVKGAVSRGTQAVKTVAQDYNNQQADERMSQQSAKIAAQAANTWNQYVRQLEASFTDPKDKTEFKNRTDKNKVYENALRAFVKKNLLKNAGNYNNLFNYKQIENWITQMSKPGVVPSNLDWQQLVKAAAVSQEIDSAPGRQNQLNPGAAPEDDEIEAPANVGIKPGQRIAVPYTATNAESPSYYYKLPDGSWTNQLNQRIKNPDSIEYLEKLIPKVGKIERDLEYVPPAEVPAKKTSKRKQQRKAQ